MNGNEAIGNVMTGVGRALWWLGRWHPWACTGLVVAATVAAVAGVGALAAAVVLVTAAGTVWAWVHRDSFRDLVAARARASWRREAVYRRRWRPAMFLSGLACRFDGEEVIPQLGRVRSSWAADVVRVRITPAQESIDWESRSGALAQTFGAQECRARATSRPHWIELEFTFRRDIPAIAALAVPSRPDLDGLTIGRRGDGRPWRLRLRGTHVLVGGATEAGKGSVLWSIIRSLLAWTHAGVAELWVADPKGGVEMGHGTINATGEPSCPLFARFARTPAAIAEMLDEAVEAMLARAQRLAGVARQHEPTVEEPLVVVIIDELAHLATYSDENMRDRVRQALGILLSEGRALGFHVIAAVQRPGQLKPDLRRAFPTRIALRTVDADEVEMILGQEAWVRGARCERIAKTTPGCGWVLLDGDREPTWVRASWIDDNDIARMAATYPAPTPAADDVDVDRDDDLEEVA